MLHIGLTHSPAQDPSVWAKSKSSERLPERLVGGQEKLSVGLTRGGTGSLTLASWRMSH